MMYVSSAPAAVVGSMRVAVLPPRISPNVVVGASGVWTFFERENSNIVLSPPLTPPPLKKRILPAPSNRTTPRKFWKLVVPPKDMVVVAWLVVLALPIHWPVQIFPSAPAVSVMLPPSTVVMEVGVPGVELPPDNPTVAPLLAIRPPVTAAGPLAMKKLAPLATMVPPL